MALWEDSMPKKRIGGPSTKLFEIKEKAPLNERQSDRPSAAPTTSVKLLRGIHISELYGTTINPDPKGALDSIVDKKLSSASSSSSPSSSPSSTSTRGSRQRQKEISASSKSEYVIDKEIVVTEHLTENLIRQLTGCTDLSTLRGLEVKINVTADSTVGNFGCYLPQLRKLKLSDSSITCLREMGTGFNNLKVIWMSRCGLEDLDGVSAMHNLKEVYLPYNLIHDLSPCGMLDSLEVLDLEGNTIDDVEQVDFLSLCGSLTHLTLEGNPVCLMPTANVSSNEGYDYRRRVFEAVPHLQYLDDVKLEETTSTTTTKATTMQTTTTGDSAKTKKPATTGKNVTTDFAEDWAFINSFLGNGGGACGGNGGNMVGVIDHGSGNEVGATARGGAGGGRLTVRDICGGNAEELYRKTAASKAAMIGGKDNKSVTASAALSSSVSTTGGEKKNLVEEASAPLMTSPRATPKKTTLPTEPSTITPPFRVRSTIVTSRRPPTTSSARRPSTGSAGGGRPFTSSSAPSSSGDGGAVVRPPTASIGIRPQTAPNLVEEVEEENDDSGGGGGGGRRRATYSELTVGATVCGNISRSLKSRSKKSLPTFIDLDPQSMSRRPESKSHCNDTSSTDAEAPSGGRSGRIVDASDRRDDLDLNPLKVSSLPPASSSGSRKSSSRSCARSSSSVAASIDKIEEEEEREDFDDDFVIHVVDSAQQHTHLEQQQQQNQQRQQLPPGAVQSGSQRSKRTESVKTHSRSADSADSDTGAAKPSFNVVNSAANAVGGAIPKLRVPTPPTSSRAPSTSSSGISSASSRRTRLTARLSADGKLQSSSTDSSPALPPLNPLKKSF